MKKLLALSIILLAAISTLGQTQHDRIHARGASTFDQYSNTQTIAMAGATPSVVGGNVFRTNNGGSTTVTNFLGGVDSQQITIVCGDANTIIQNNANIVITGGSNFNCVVDTAISFVFSSNTSKWGQIGGSGAGGGNSPGAPAQSAQCNDGLGGFVACNARDDNTNFAINDNVQFLGPNPYIDVARYGQYANASPPSTTASCTNASTAITLASALDFKDASAFPKTNLGNGIVIYKCGSPTDLITPVAPTVVPSGQLGIAASGITGGATTYNYKFVAQSEKLGLTAASPAGTTTTGATTLGLNTVNLTSVTWNSTLNGEQVYTCSGNCNIGDSTPIRIDGFANARFNGNYTTIAHTATTFTVYSPSVPAPAVTTESIAATVKLLACNTLTMPANATLTVEAGSDQVLRWIIYRNNVLIGYAQARDPYYEDCGMNVAGGNFESFVPTSPGAAINNSLITTIVSGAGTTSIVVANAAGATTGGQTAQHDNSKNVLTALAAGVGSTFVYLNGLNTPFNAPTIFTSTVNSTKLLLPVGPTLKEPWIVRGSGITFEGGQNNQSSGSFQLENPTTILGSTFAYPTVGVEEGHNQQGLHGVVFKNILFNATQLGSEAFEVDMDASNLFGLQMQNVGFFNSLSTSNLNTPPARFRGLSESAIGKPGDRNACATAQIAPGPICMRFSSVSVAMNNGSVGNATLARDTQINGFAVQGGGTSYQFDTLPWLNSGGVSPFGAINVEIRNGLREIGKGPFVRTGGSSSAYDFKISYIDDDAPNATPGNGFIDTAAGSGPNPTVVVDHLTGSVSGQSIVAGPGIVYVGPTVLHVGPPGVTTGTAFSSSPGWSGTGNVQALGTAQVGYQMGTPNTPSVVVGGSGSCSSNCVAAGSYLYKILAMDPYGNASPISAFTSTVVTDGTQTITLNITPISGQILTNPCRAPLANPTALFCLFNSGPGGSGVGGNSFVDSSLNFYTNSAFNQGAGSSTSMGSLGTLTPALVLTGGGFKSTVTGTFTANRTITAPDASGTMMFTNTSLALGQTPLTTNGDLLTVSGGVFSRKGIGADGTFLGVSGGVHSYIASSGSGSVCLTTSCALITPTVGTSLTMNGAAELRFVNGANYVGLKAPATLGSNFVWALPNVDSTGTQCLSSNGSLALAWSTCSAGTGSPGGSPGNIQYSNTTFAGSPAFTFNGTDTVSIGQSATTLGKLKMFGNTSGGPTIQAQAVAGTPTLTLPTTTGTFAVSTNPPLSLDATTGVLSAPTAVTSASSLGVNELVLGSAAQGAHTLGSKGTVNQVYHGNAAGDGSFSAVSLTADVSGQLPFSNGGCGGTTAAGCFDNIAPTTTQGDLIVRGSSSNTRIPVAPNGSCLISTGTTWTGGSCASGAITGAGAAGQLTFWGTSSSITGHANFTYVPASGASLTQGANGADAFTLLRATDTSPTGNYFRLRNAANSSDIYRLDTLGNIFATSFSGIGPGAAYFGLGQGPAQPIIANTIGLTAPTAVTGYNIVFPGIAGTGVLRFTNSANILTSTIVPASGVGSCTSANNVVVAVNDNAGPQCSTVAGPMFGTQAANLVFKGPNSGTPAFPTFAPLVSADVPPINLNTNGSNGGVTAVLGFINGGCNATSSSGCFNNIWPGTTLGDTVYGAALGAGTRLPGNITTTPKYLRQVGDGANSAAPTWTQPTFSETGGTASIAQGGSGQVTANAALNAFLPSQTGNSGKCLTTDSANTAWGTCGSGGGQASPSPNYGTSFSSQTSVTITGTTHNMGSKNLLVACYDNSSPAKAIQPASWTIDGTTFDIVVNFAVAQSGYCAVNGTGPNRYAATFGSTTSLTVLGTTHKLGTPDLTVTVWDSSSGTRKIVQPASVSVDSTTFDVTITFATSQSGRIVLQ